ncbi:MAG: LLM class flavin-dependent oxidoreductase [Myxococcota bacterium]
MALSVESGAKFGFICGMRDSRDARDTVELAERWGYDSIWVGDHIEFPLPLLDPFVQLSHAAAFSTKLTFGTAVYLMPLRHLVPLAKQVASLDIMSDGRFIFGAGVGGEFPNEWAACGVPHSERGARMSEGIPLLKQLLTGETVENPEGRFYPFDQLTLKPAATSAPGPPVWTGGRSKAALTRSGAMADGWIGYSVTPEMYRDALTTIEAAAAGAGREIDVFGTGDLLFTQIGDTYEEAFESANAHLSMRYAMDFSRATKKYCALGRPEDVAARYNEFYEAGCRHFVLDLTSTGKTLKAQIERFGREVRPLLSF